jgi:hypothetical protein
LRAARLTNFENADVLLTLVDAYAEQGRYEQAERTARQALEAVPAGNPQLGSLIRRRMQEIREAKGREKKKD